MAVITITISESSTQIISGIPYSVSLTTNLPSTIFYTLNGTDPTFDSEIIIGDLVLPTEPNVILKLLASNGIDSSAVITQTYSATNIGEKIRRPHSAIQGLDISTIKQYDLAPFGSNSPNTDISYSGMGGKIVDSVDIDGIPDGYDGAGTNTNKSETDESIENYTLKYSERDYLGQSGKGIGNLPASVRLRIPGEPSNSSNTGQTLFNPKSLVIFQDGREEPDLNNIILNRPSFSLENPEKVKDGRLLSAADEKLTSTGSLVRSFYNAREQTITYYYYDNSCCRWIISKEPYTPSNDQIFNYSKVVLPAKTERGGERYVYKWLNFQSRKLI